MTDDHNHTATTIEIQIGWVRKYSKKVLRNDVKDKDLLAVNKHKTWVTGVSASNSVIKALISAELETLIC